MIDSEAIAEARRALGRQLAMYRRAAGLNQEQLASLVHYGRSTVANVETGRQNVTRTFWERVDPAVKADGALVRGYAELQALIRRVRQEAARESTRAAKYRQLQNHQDGVAQQCSIVGSTATWPAQGQAPLSALTETVVQLCVRVDGKEMAVSLDRRLLMQIGMVAFLDAFGLKHQAEAAKEMAEEPTPADRLALTSPAHLDEVIAHLREQWHALVKTDNLFGPRFALGGVLGQLAIVEALLGMPRATSRSEALRLGAQYAESAAWLYEDAANMTQARYWTSRSLEWAHEADDKKMLGWILFRRSQQAAASRDAAQVIGLAQAARRDEARLASPTRAAIRVQEAFGHALDSNGRAAQQLLDQAHTWAANDTAGDARAGHGSYCTASYIEVQRASCWLALGQPKSAIAAYEHAVPSLPAVYQRDRAASLSRLAAAYAAYGQVEQAASAAFTALPVARAAGSHRILGDIKAVGRVLEPHRALKAVGDLLDDLDDESGVGLGQPARA